MSDKPTLLDHLSAEKNDASAPETEEKSASLLSLLTEEAPENNAVENKDALTSSNTPLFGTIKVDPKTSSSEGQLLSPIKLGETKESDAADTKTPLLGAIESDTARQEVVVGQTTVAEEPAQLVSNADSASGLQYANYFSFILVLILAGFAAVQLFRKAASFSAERMMSAGHLFGLGCGIFVLHSFANVYLYSSYLNGARETLPLAFALAVWVVVAPLAPVIVSKLTAAAGSKGMDLLGAPLAAVGAICAMLSVLDGLSMGVSAGLSVAGLALIVVPSARGFASYNAAKAKQAELQHSAVQRLSLSLSAFPVVAAVFALLGALALGAELVLFALNLSAAAFAVVTALSILQSGKVQVAVAETEPKSEPSEAQAPIKETPEPVVEAPVVKEPVVEQPVAPVASAPVAKAPSKPKVAAAVEEKNSESEASLNNLPKPPAPVPVAKKAPVKKYTSTVENRAPAAPNAPSTIKAPAKPKKRF